MYGQEMLQEIYQKHHQSQLIQYQEVKVHQGRVMMVSAACGSGADSIFLVHLPIEGYSVYKRTRLNHRQRSLTTPSGMTSKVPSREA